MINNVINQVLPLIWTLIFLSPDGEMEVPAVVPGAAQLDVATALSYPDYNVGTNYKCFQWMEDTEFTYRTVFDAPKVMKDESVWFVSKGIDYECAIFLNGFKIMEHEGSYSPIEVCLTEHLVKKRNVLEVRISKIPKRAGYPDTRDQASMVCKAPCSYGWDWHPRLVPSGIWDETGIKVMRASWIESVKLDYELSDDFTTAGIKLNVAVGGSNKGSVIWNLYDDSGRVVASATNTIGNELSATLENPTLWWTHDHGTPYLYKSVVEIVRKDGKILDRKEEKVGFRRVRLVMNTDGWSRPSGPSKSRSEAPSQIELNGRRIFAKGTNWLAPEIFQGKITPNRYKELLEFCCEANFNTLRCWGGCGISKDSFFDACDSLGLLVWQEFPLSCNNYPDDPHYLSVLEQEARAITMRLHDHPCVAILCGGNELFNSWSGMTDQSLALRLLNAVCLEVSPSTPFLATSPLNGMAHGCYLFRMGDREVFEWMNEGDYGAYCEFGVPSAAPVEILKNIIPEEELFPVAQTESWIAHHAFKAWVSDSWLAPSTIEYYFGQSRSLEELVDNSAILQGEGYKCIFEEARRKKPHCAMALNWCFNEPWPTAANNSIISYPSVKKPAFEDVKAACRPLLASARFNKYLWSAGEELVFDMWLLNDSFGPNNAYTLRAVLVNPDGSETELTTWKTPVTKENTNLRGPAVHTVLPPWTGINRFSVKILVEGHQEMNSTYTLAYRSL